jgi:predicted metal-binding membrane protein
MAVLVVLGGMQLGWALALALVISLEKLAPWGAVVARGVALGAAGLGIALLVAPGLLDHLVSMSTSMNTPM